MSEPELPSPELTPQEEQELMEVLGAGSYPQIKEQTGLIGFFKKILSITDSTKVANVNEQELTSVRIKQEAAVYAKTMGYDKVAEYMEKEAEVILASSNSKDGFLIKQVNTQKRQFESQSTQGGKSRFKKQ